VFREKGSPGEVGPCLFEGKEELTLTSVQSIGEREGRKQASITPAGKKAIRSYYMGKRGVKPL